MDLIIHLPRLLDICNCFCFVCITVGEEDCMTSFFTFFFFCHQSSLFKRILISCLIRMKDSVSLPCVSPSLCDIPSVINHSVLHLCNESSRICCLERIIISAECLRIARISLNSPSSSLQIWNLVMNLLRWRQFNQSSYMNSFAIPFSILEVWIPSKFVWHIPRIFLSEECVCVYTFLLESPWCQSNHTYLKMRVSTECLLQICHPEIVVQILSSRRISLFV